MTPLCHLCARGQLPLQLCIPCQAAVERFVGLRVTFHGPRDPEMLGGDHR